MSPFGETRDLVSLNECGAEPSANSFLPGPSTTGTVKMLIASTRSLASSAWTSSVLPWVTRFGPSSCFRRFTSAMSRRSTEPAQLVSTSPLLEAPVDLFAELLTEMGHHPAAKLEALGGILGRPAGR